MENDEAGGFVVMAEKNPHIFEEIVDITEKTGLAEALAGELAKYTIYDIIIIRAWGERELELLPSPYREKARSYSIESQYGRYIKAMAMLSDGGFKNFKRPIRDLDLFREFCDTDGKYMKEMCDNDDDDPLYGSFNGLYYLLYYLLLSCFYMFVLEEPEHPIGTPFPGGFTVRQQGGEYYCPTREKEKDVWYSICNFCSARQDESNR